MTAGLAIGSSPPIPKKASEHPVSRTAEVLTPRGSEVAIASIPDSPASDDLEKYDVNLLASDRDGASPKPTKENLIENLLSLEAEAGNLTTVSTKKETFTAASAVSGNCLTSSSASPNFASAFSKIVLPEEDTNNKTTSKKPKTEESERGRRRSSVGNSSKQSQKLPKPEAEAANLMESKREIATQTFSEDFALFSCGSSSNPTTIKEKPVLDKKLDKCQSKSCGYLRQKHGLKAKLEGTPVAEERLEKREKNSDTGNISKVANGHHTPDLSRSQGMSCGFIGGNQKDTSKSARSVCEYLKKTSKTDNHKIKNKPPMASYVQESGSGSFNQNPSAKRRKSVDSSVPFVHEHQQRANVFINKFELRPNTFNIPTRESDGFNLYPAALNAASHAFEKLPDLYAISSNVPYNAFQVPPKNDFYIDNNTLNGYSVNSRMPLYNQSKLCNAVNMPCNAFHPERQNQNVIYRTGLANPPFSYSQPKGNVESKNTAPEKTESPLCEYLNRKKDKPPPAPPTHHNLQPTGIITDNIANVHTSSKPHFIGEDRSFGLNNMESFAHEEIRRPRKKSSPDILQILATHPKSQCQYLKNYQKFLLKQAATKAIEKNKTYEQSFSSMQSPLPYGSGVSLDSSVNQIPMQGFVPMQIMNTGNAGTAGRIQGPSIAETSNPPGTFSWHGEGMGPSHRIELGSQQDFMQVSTKSANRLERSATNDMNLHKHVTSAQKMDSLNHVLLAQNMSDRYVNDLPSRHTCEYLKTKSPEEAPEDFRRRGNAATFSPSQSLTYSSRLESPSKSDPGLSMEDEAMLGSGTKTSSDLGLDAATMVSTRRPICEFILKNQRCIEKIKETLHREKRNACSENEKASRRTPIKGTVASPPGRSSANSNSGREDSMPQHLFQILMAVIVSYFLIEKELGKVS